MSDRVSCALERTSDFDRHGTLDLGAPRPTIDIHARHIQYALLVDTAPVVIREGEGVVLLSTSAPRSERGVLVKCWDEDADRFGWRGAWVVDGYTWCVALDDGVLSLWAPREVIRWEAAA